MVKQLFQFPVSIFLICPCRYSTFQYGNSPTKLPPSPEIMMHSVLIHDYYSRFDPNAIFLTVDTSLRNGRLEIQAYARSKVGLPGKTEGIIFTPIPCEVVYFEPEKVALQMLRGTVASPNISTVPVISDFSQIEKYNCQIEHTHYNVYYYIGPWTP